MLCQILWVGKSSQRDLVARGDSVRETPRTPMQKIDILKKTDFGKQVAEDEAKHLRDYFVETTQWKSLLSGDVDIVYGAKGAGKSALYSLLLTHEEELQKKGISVVAAENPRGATVFRELVTDPPAGEEEFRGLWKLYFLCLIGTRLRTIGNLGAAALQVVRKLEEAKLLPPDGTLGGMLRSVLDYVRRAAHADSIGVGIELDQTSGMAKGIMGRITLREPSSHLKEAGLMSVDDLLKQADTALVAADRKIWVLLDRLDVAFAESDALECSALRALFRVYLDLIALNAIGLKIFLRSDIWDRITYKAGHGFREASHISRHTTISWSNQSLLNLIIRRLLHSEAICTEYKADPDVVLADTGKQNKLFNQIFPRERNLDWMLSRLRDGSRKTAPREIVHFLHCVREIQIKKLELGGQDPPAETLFGDVSMSQALPEVSRVRFTQTLCAEYPRWRSSLLRLKGERAHLSLPTLAKIWQTTPQEAADIAENLVEIGFFQKQGTRDNPNYWIPYLYQYALEIKEKRD
jgi:hypothetical protein